MIRYERWKEIMFDFGDEALQLISGYVKDVRNQVMHACTHGHTTRILSVRRLARTISLT
jgi:hypothetical protein